MIVLLQQYILFPVTLTLHQFSIPQFTSVGLSRQCSRKIFDKFYLKSKGENSFLIKEVSQRSLSGCLDKLTMDKLKVNCKELRPFQPITDHLKCLVYKGVLAFSTTCSKRRTE